MKSLDFHPVVADSTSTLSIKHFPVWSRGMRGGCVALAAVLLVLLGCDKKEAPKAFEMPPTPVDVVDVVTKDVPLYIDEIGRCTAREMVAIKPQASGQIMAIHFEDGAMIKKGDLLFTIDQRTYQAALDVAKAALAQSEAKLELAKSEFERAEKLVGSKAISQEDFDKRKNEKLVAQATVLSSKAAIESAEVSLNYCVIRSPIDGRAGHRLVDIGNVVNAYNMDTTLLVIQRMDPIYVDFTITERDLTEVRKHMAEATLKAQVRAPEDGELPAVAGDLTFLDNAVQDATGTVKVRATIPNADGRFWPGQFVKTRLVLTTIKDAPQIPSTAIQISQQGPFVYVINKENAAELRVVKLGQKQADMTTVETGIKAGEQVVTVGQMMVQPGMKVMVVSVNGKPVAPPAGAPGAPPQQTAKAEAEPAKS